MQSTAPRSFSATTAAFWRRRRSAFALRDSCFGPTFRRACAIIAALLTLGHSVDRACATVTRHWCPRGKSIALHQLAKEIFGDGDFNSFNTNVCSVLDASSPIVSASPRGRGRTDDTSAFVLVRRHLVFIL